MAGLHHLKSGNGYVALQVVCNGSVHSVEDAHRLVRSTLLAHQVPGGFLEAGTTAALNALQGERPLPQGYSPTVSTVQVLWCLVDHLADRGRACSAGSTYRSLLLFKPANHV